MGCSQSKIENEEAVLRCKERKQFMKESLSARNAFAAAHAGYAMNLKNTGAALSDFAHAEIPSHLHASSSSADPSSFPAAPPSLSHDTLLPPPPLPPPNFSSSPLQRAASMPEIKISKPEAKPAGPAIIEEDETAEVEVPDGERLVRRRGGSSRRGSGSTRGGSESGPPRQQWSRREEETASRAPAHVRDHVVQNESTWEAFLFAPVEDMAGTTLAEPPVEPEEEFRKSRAEEKRIEEEEDEGKEEVVVAEEKKKKAVAVEVPVQVEVGPVVQEKKGLVKRPGKALNLVWLFEQLDDHFLKASQSAHEVSKMLEATRLHYHSNFADNRGHIDHSARVMRVITWNRSIKGIPSVDDGKDDIDSEDHETHATVLDKLLAWEKKLYDEVKVGEQMKYDYQKKVVMLNKQKKKGANPESLEKLKAAVSLLHTRYIVDMQSMDSTVSEINRLRDDQLYPKLVQLVEGMGVMWEAMRGHHEKQSKIANDLRCLDITQSPVQTSDHHHQRTCQLLFAVGDWHSDFCKLIDNQRNYIKALNSWLKLNLIPIESSLKEKVSSPPRIQNPPIQALLVAWDEFMDKLHDESARSAIKNFAAVIHSISQHQEDEMKMRDKCEEVRKELARKTRQFEDWHNKYIQQRVPDELDPERTEDNDPHKDAIAERQVAVDALKKRLEEEEEAYQKQCLQVRQKSLASLKTRLPDLFRAMLDISRTFAEMYKKLRPVSQDRN